jgi:hypothetical protein
MVALLKMPRLTPQAATSAAEEAGGTLRMERRVFVRKDVRDRVEARRVDHSLLARRQPHLSLSLRDLSVGGLSAITDVRLEEGERLAVFFPPQGFRSGWDAYGRVVRCEASALGYRVAVEFESLPAA